MMFKISQDFACTGSSYGRSNYSLMNNSCVSEEDVFQVGMEILVKDLQENKYKPFKSNLTTYVFSSIVNKISNYLFKEVPLIYVLSHARDKTKFYFNDLENLRNLSTKEYGKNEKMCVDSLLSYLTGTERKIMEMFYLEDISYKEIIQELGIKNIKALNSRIRYAKAKLRKKFADRIEDFY